MAPGSRLGEKPGPLAVSGARGDDEPPQSGTDVVLPGLGDRVGRLGSERAMLDNRAALVQRKLQYLDQQLDRKVQAQLAVVREVARRAIAQAST